jgi:hypothetical protein
MTDDNANQSTLQIPPETQARFPELIALITQSESMNVNEQQYWVNILPIMTPEQLQNLDIDDVGQQAQQDHITQERQFKRRERLEFESENDEAEKSAEQALLDEINSQ